MGYVICEKCGGYYELQPGEHPEDFSDTCECGGKLRYERRVIDEDYNIPSSEFKLPSISKNFKTIALGMVVIIISLIKFAPMLLGLFISFMPVQTWHQYSGYIMPLIGITAIISIIASRVLRPWRF